MKGKIKNRRKTKGKGNKYNKKGKKRNEPYQQQHT
jgi:hypothetical protein